MTNSKTFTNEKNLTAVLEGLAQLASIDRYPGFTAEIVNGQIVLTVDEDPAAPAEPEIKFMYNGMKVDGKLCRASYSYQNSEYGNRPFGTITLYAKDYSRFPVIPAGMIHMNDTDSQTDYFDSDKIFVYPNHPRYREALAAYCKAQEVDDNRRAKHAAKRAAKR